MPATTERSDAIQELFRDPAFTDTFSEYQYLSARAERLHDKLFQAMVDARASDDEALTETVDGVSDSLEYAAEKSEEELEAEWEPYFMDRREYEAFKSIKKSEDLGTEARQKLLELGNAHELGKFAVYGLNQHLDGKIHLFSLAKIERDTKKTEGTLQDFETTISSHAGKKVLMVGLIGAWASRLVEGEVHIKHDRLVLPTEKTYGVISMDLKEEYHTRVFEDEDIYVPIYPVLKEGFPIFELSDPKQAKTFWEAGVLFDSSDRLFVGEPPHGPFDLTRVNPRDIDFYSDLSSRTRLAASLVSS